MATVMNFPMLSYEQANPAMAGVQQGTQTIGDILQNQSKQQMIAEEAIRQKYLDPTLQEALQQQKYQTQIMAPQAQYAPQTTLADLMYKQAQTPNLQAQTGLINQQSKYYGPKTMAEIGEANARTSTMPYTALGQYYGGLGKVGMANYYNAPSTRLSRLLNTPEMLSLIQTNPQVAEAVLGGLASTVDTAGGMGQGGGSQSTLPAGGNAFEQVRSLFPTASQIPGSTLSPAASLPQGMQMPQQQPQAQQITAQQPSTQPPNRQPIKVTPQDISAVQKNVADVLEKKTTTANILNQRQYAVILDGLFSSADGLMPSVVQYSGIVGKGKKGIDALKSAFGDTSQEYQDYLLFTRTTAPNLSNEMRRVLGGQATDYEGKVMKNLSDPNYWDSNPQQAMKQYQYLKSVYQTKVGPALAMHPSEALEQINLAAATYGQPTTQQNNDPLGIR